MVFIYELIIQKPNEMYNLKKHRYHWIIANL